MASGAVVVVGREVAIVGGAVVAATIVPAAGAGAMIGGDGDPGAGSPGQTTRLSPVGSMRGPCHVAQPIMVTIPTEMARTASQFRHVDVRIIDAEGPPFKRH